MVDMKIRAGFVSNSSSSSFCVFGQWVGELMDHEQWEIKLTAEQKEIMREYGLGYRTDEGDVLIGRNWDSIGDDETGAELKQSVRDAFKKMGIENEPESMEGIIYD
jgi:hypothetical protein